MRCFICRNQLPTPGNPFLELTTEISETVTDHYGLVRIDGPDDCFMPDDGSETSGLVIVCQDCINKAVAEHILDSQIRIRELQKEIRSLKRAPSLSPHQAHRLIQEKEAELAVLTTNQAKGPQQP